MQWRALVLGLVLLWLGLHAMLWLVFGLGPSMGFYQRFPLSFGFQCLRVPDSPASPASGPEGRPGGPSGLSWLRVPGSEAAAAAAGRRRAPRGPGPGVCGPTHWGFVLGGRGRGPDEYEKRYSGAFPQQLRAQMRDLARGMFVFGYDNYMAHAFPQDELNPIHCRGPEPDRGNPSNLNINDVLGNYSLMLVDALDTLAIIGNSSEFQKAVKLVINTISFDKESTVQVFEATIRVLGSLLSAHRITDSKQPFGDMTIKDYDNELLHMAHDLAVRLLPAFENTKTGIPYLIGRAAPPCL
ncbi:hypothetical protein MC885_003196 [Smutsia gigantea]|nr:hypothetical protein MC885_003196 [Smutsia gigantea]